MADSVHDTQLAAVSTPSPGSPPLSLASSSTSVTPAVTPVTPAPTPSPTYSKANSKHIVNATIPTKSHLIHGRQRASSLAGTNPLSHAEPAPAIKTRKRLSMNFALPVVSYNASSTQSPTSATTPRRSVSGFHAPSAPTSLSPHMGGSAHSKTQSFSHSGNSPTVRQPHTVNNNGSPNHNSASSNHRQSASVSFASPMSPPNKAHNSRSKNLSSDSNGSATSTSTTTNNSIANTNSSIASPSTKVSTIEYYFSQLAYRERRVVELRDEISRMQLQLRQAEDDLTDFRKQVPAELMPQGMGPSPASEKPANASPGLSRSHTISGPTTSIASHKLSDDAKPRRSTHIHSPFTLMDSVAKTSEPTRHRLAASSSSISSAGSSILSHKAAHHSNSLSDSSSSSVEALDEVKPMVAPTIRSSIHGANQNTHHTPQHSSLYQHEDLNDGAGGDMFHAGLHTGRRVVEELGTQFWSFFEDIKNVTVGEAARDTTYVQDQPMGVPPRKPRRRYEEPSSEVIVTGVATSSSLQRRGSTGVRTSISMGNLNCHMRDKSEITNSKNLRTVPEVSSNSYYIV